MDQSFQGIAAAPEAPRILGGHLGSPSTCVRRKLDHTRGIGWSHRKYSVNPYLIEHNLININQLWRRSISALWMMVRRNRKEINELRLEATG